MAYDFIWVDADGNSMSLIAENGFKVLTGATGLDAPPVELNTEARTAGDGSIMLKRRTGIRHVALPLLVTTENTVPMGASWTSRDNIARLAEQFAGPGTLRVARDGITYRELRQAYYEVGLEGDEAGDLSSLDAWRKVVVSLQALDPWWYAGTATRAITFGGTPTPFDNAGTTFDDPLTGFNGGDETTIEVGGHADAYPVWTIVGPFTTLVIEVAGSGSFELAGAQSAATTITVDTRPGSTRGPRLGNNEVNWALLTAGSRLPTFAPGAAVVTALTAGSTGASSITVAHEPRWLTP